MSETVLDQILVELQRDAAVHYPQRGELKSLRVVGHTPKSDHFIHDVCADFPDGMERLAIKIYRSNKSGAAKTMAKVENSNLEFVQQLLRKKKLNGLPRLVGDFSEQ